MDNKVQQLKEILDKARTIVVFTGAGISVPSGIPDFRSSSGLYNQKTKYNIAPEEIISHSFFMQHTDMFYEFYKSKMIYPNAKPNKAHKFFAELQKKKEVRVVTQNIDGLHQEAGSKIVYELHGSVLRNYCMNCNKFYELKDIMEPLIPRCTCGGIIKPDVVLYEEGLDGDILNASLRAIESADTLIIVGTSLSVQPAASLVRYFFGKNLIIINKDITPYDYVASLVINDDVVKVIGELESL